MKILGIDPGTVVMGWGVVEGEGTELALVDFGVITVSEKTSMGERLNRLYTELLKIVRQHQPDCVAVEQPFVAKNVRTALAIGRAQASDDSPEAIEGTHLPFRYAHSACPFSCLSLDYRDGPFSLTRGRATPNMALDSSAPGSRGGEEA